MVEQEQLRKMTPVVVVVVVVDELRMDPPQYCFGPVLLLFHQVHPMKLNP